jgi:hypothetical protein
VRPAKETGSFPLSVWIKSITGPESAFSGNNKLTLTCPRGERPAEHLLLTLFPPFPNLGHMFFCGKCLPIYRRNTAPYFFLYHIIEKLDEFHGFPIGFANPSEKFKRFA